MDCNFWDVGQCCRGSLLARLNVNSTNNDVLVAMLVLGLGLGIGMSLYTLIVQNALPTKIGQSTATLHSSVRLVARLPLQRWVQL